MGIKKGKIRNINKKLIAGVLTISLITIPLLGCSELKVVNNSTIVQENSKNVANFNKIKNSYFIVIKNSENDMLDYYIAERINYYEGTSNKINGHIYVNLANGINVFARRVDAYYGDAMSYSRSKDLVLIDEISLEDYLYNLDMIKDMYTEKDIDEILIYMKQEYLNEKNNQKG